MPPRNKLRLYLRKRKHSFQRSPLARQRKGGDTPQPDAEPVEEANVRHSLANPGTMSSRDIKTAQRAYGNQFVQRLALGTEIRGTSAPRVSIQRAAAGAAAVNANVEERIEGARGGGQALPKDTQSQMSESFGADFSGVRVHTGTESNQLNRSLNARAFTTGQDVFFADNEYNPHSSGGQELIAHELTHVVQQGAAPAKPAQRAATTGDDEEETVLTKPVEAQRDHQPGEEDELPGGLSLKRLQTSLQRAALPGMGHLDGLLTGLMPAPSTSTEHKSVQRAEGDEVKPEDKKELIENAKDQGKETSAGAGQNSQADQAKGAPSAGLKEEKKEAGDNQSKPDQKPEAGGGGLGGPQPNLPDIEPTPLPPEAEMAQVPDQSFGQAMQVYENLKWEKTNPPDWDAETALFDLFTNGNMDMPAVQRKAAVQRTASGGDAVGQAAVKEPQDPTTTAVAKDPPPAFFVAAPTTGNMMGDMPINAVMGFTGASAALNAINNVGAITTETNPFGVMARLMEIAVNIMEVISAVISVIDLIVIITKWTLIIVGAILRAIGAATVWAFGAGAPLIAAGEAMSAFATGTLTPLDTALTAILVKLAIIRIQMRLIVVFLRVLDIAWSAAAGADAATLRKKGWLVADQAFGMAVDGLSILGGSAQVKADGGGLSTATTVGLRTLQYGSGFALKPGVAIARGATNQYSGRNATEENERKQEGTLVNRAEGEAQPLRANLPEPPLEAPDKVNATAFNMAALEEEKLLLTSRLSFEDKLLASKTMWDVNMQASQQNMQMHQNVMAGQNKDMITQQAAADQFSEKAGEGGEKAGEGKQQNAAISGALASSEPAVNNAMDKTEEHKSQSQGHADEEASQIDPAKAPDPASANKDKSQANDAANQTPTLMNDGVAQGQRSKQETQKVKDHNQNATKKTEDVETQLETKRNQNKDEVAKLGDDKQAVMARLAEIAALQGALKAEHDTVLQQATTWTTQHKTARLATMGTLGIEEDDLQVEVPPAE